MELSEQAHKKHSVQAHGIHDPSTLVTNSSFLFKLLSNFKRVFWGIYLNSNPFRGRVSEAAPLLCSRRAATTQLGAGAGTCFQLLLNPFLKSNIPNKIDPKYTPISPRANSFRPTYSPLNDSLIKNTSPFQLMFPPLQTFLLSYSIP